RLPVVPLGCNAEPRQRLPAWQTAATSRPQPVARHQEVSVQDSPLIDLRNQTFVLDTLLEVDSLCELPPFSDHSRETFEAALDAAHDLALSRFAPHNRAADENEPKQQGG